MKLNKPMPILVAGLRDHSHLKSADAMFDAMPLTISAIEASNHLAKRSNQENNNTSLGIY